MKHSFLWKPCPVQANGFGVFRCELDDHRICHGWEIHREYSGQRDVAVRSRGLPDVHPQHRRAHVLHHRSNWSHRRFLHRHTREQHRGSDARVCAGDAVTTRELMKCTQLLRLVVGVHNQTCQKNAEEKVKQIVLPVSGPYEPGPAAAGVRGVRYDGGGRGAHTARDEGRGDEADRAGGRDLHERTHVRDVSMVRASCARVCPREETKVTALSPSQKRDSG